MRIQVQSFKGKRSDDPFVNEIQRRVEGNLARFGERIRNVDVLIVDYNEQPNDKQCFIEARLDEWEPIAVRAHAGTFERAVEVGAEKIAGTIEERDHHPEARDVRSFLD